MKLPSTLCDFSICPEQVKTITPTIKLPENMCPCPETDNKILDFHTFKVSNSTENFDDVLDAILLKKTCKIQGKN